MPPLDGRRCRRRRFHRLGLRATGAHPPPVPRLADTEALNQRCRKTVWRTASCSFSSTPCSPTRSMCTLHLVADAGIQASRWLKRNQRIRSLPVTVCGSFKALDFKSHSPKLATCPQSMSFDFRWSNKSRKRLQDLAIGVCSRSYFIQL